MKKQEFNSLELLDNHPLSCKLITEWFTNIMIESFQDEEVPEEFKQMMRDTGIEKPRLATIIQANPICLAYLLDENNIKHEIMLTLNDEFYVMVNKYQISTQLHKTRKEAEIETIIYCFNRLEQKLTKDLDIANGKII